MLSVVPASVSNTQNIITVLYATFCGVLVISRDLGYVRRARTEQTTDDRFSKSPWNYKLFNTIRLAPDGLVLNPRHRAHTYVCRHGDVRERRASSNFVRLEILFRDLLSTSSNERKVRLKTC